MLWNVRTHAAQISSTLWGRRVQQQVGFQNIALKCRCVSFQTRCVTSTISLVAHAADVKILEPIG